MGAGVLGIGEDRYGHAPRDVGAREVGVPALDCHGIGHATDHQGETPVVLGGDGTSVAAQPGGGVPAQLLTGLLVPAALGGAHVGDRLDPGSGRLQLRDPVRGDVGQPGAAVAVGDDDVETREGHLSVLAVAEAELTAAYVDGDVPVVRPGLRQVAHHRPGLLRQGTAPRRWDRAHDHSLGMHRPVPQPNHLLRPSVALTGDLVGDGGEADGGHRVVAQQLDVGCLTGRVAAGDQAAAQPVERPLLLPHLPDRDAVAWPGRSARSRGG